MKQGRQRNASKEVVSQSIVFWLDDIDIVLCLTFEENRRIFIPQFRYQFLRHEDAYVVAKGGVGGVGPQSFKKRDGRKGTAGTRVRIELELSVHIRLPISCNDPWRL